MARVRKIASRLELDESVLHMAIVNGLKPAVRLQVAQRGLQDLEQTIKTAKIAEAAGASATDTVTTALFDMMKSPMKASEKQESHMHQLTNSFAALTRERAPTTPQ